VNADWLGALRLHTLHTIGAQDKNLALVKSLP